MKFVFLVVALVHAVTCGNIGVRTSHHLSPADVTYVHGSYHAGLAAGPIGYSASLASGPVVSAGPVATVTAAPIAAVSAGPALAAAPVAAVSAGPALAAAPVASVSAGPALAAAPVAAVSAGPALAAAPVAAVSAGPALAAAPVAAVATGPALAAAPVAAPVARISTVTAAPLAYAAPAPRFAAIPTVQHVPGVADVPVTRIDAQPAVIQKTIDVARPAIKTQRYEVRRPAIQKQFYDIEERVVVRPAGSAVLELDEPLSKIQKGPSVIQPSGGPVAVSTQAVAAPSGPAVSTAIPSGPVEVSVSGVSGTLSLPSVEANLARSSLTGAAPISSSVSVAPVAAIATPVVASPAPAIASVPAVPVKTVSTPIQASLVTGISAPSGISVSSPVSVAQPIIHSTPAPLYASDDSVSIESAELSLARSSLARAQGAQLGLAKTVFQPIGRAYPSPASVVATIPSTGSVFQSAVPAARLAGHSPAAIYAARNLQSEINHENQQKLLHLLTARGGVTEIGFGRSGPAAYPVYAGDVRARVLSATPAPAFAAPAGERVNTRRVVVSRPIETLQEVEVAEPVTKFERVQVAQPTVLKSASPDVVRVPTSVPVYGKALAQIEDDSISTFSAGWK